MQAAPDHKVPAGPMPESSQQHRDHQVDVGADNAFAIAPQGDIEIIPQPGGKRDMPTAPEIGDGSSHIGHVEVDGQVEAHQGGETDSDIGIAGEIAVDLQSVTIHGQEVFHSGEELGTVEDAVHKVDADIIRDHAFLDEAGENQDKRSGDLVFVEFQLFTDLRDKPGGPHDGPRYQLGEKSHEKHEVFKALKRLELAEVDIHRVAHRLEGEEGDPHGQENIHQGQVTTAELIDGIDDEIGVFKVSERAQVPDHAQPHQRAFFAPLFRLADSRSQQEVDQGREHQQGYKKTAGLVIKIQRNQHQIPGAHLHPLHQQGVEDHHDQKEKEEKAAIEKEWYGRIVEQFGKQVLPRRH